jgi:hypothetical protein
MKERRDKETRRWGRNKLEYNKKWEPKIITKIGPSTNAQMSSITNTLIKKLSNPIRALVSKNSCISVFSIVCSGFARLGI